MTKVVMRGGEWDGEELELGTDASTLTFQPKGDVSETDYHRTDEWEGERRIYRCSEGE